MRARTWPASAMVLIVAGCAALQPDRAPDPEERLAEGLAALERGDYRGAYEPLNWVYTHYANEAVGQQALLALVAAELDPRNPSRRLGVGSELAGRYLRLPAIARWTKPVAETLYLLALELGAAEERVAEAEEEAAAAEERAREARAEAREARAEAEREREEAHQARAEAAQARAQAAPPRELPRLPGPPVTERMRELEQAGADATARVAQLEQQLAECRQELARIRRAVGP
ncbi:MAG TPA: hypothetical protein VF212_06780 [Longimicrobiales bacterium]